MDDKIIIHMDGSHQYYMLYYLPKATIAEALHDPRNKDVLRLKIRIHHKFVGWDIPLSAHVETYAADQWNASHILSFFFPEKKLKYALDAYDLHIPWPVWTDGDECFLNKEKLGSWDDYGHGPTIIPESQCNLIEDLIFFQCKNKWNAANRVMFLNALANTNNHCPLCRVAFRESVPVRCRSLWVFK